MKLATRKTSAPTRATLRRAPPQWRTPSDNETPLPDTVVTETPIPSPLQLREEARIAFLAQTMLPQLNQLELDHISALLALLVEGEWGAAVTRLLAKQSPKKKGIRDLECVETLPLPSSIPPDGGNKGNGRDALRPKHYLYIPPGRS